ILLQDDGNSAVSLPEVPLLGVLPGTGGLTRLVDKRKVRRDLAADFCTVAEGAKGKRAERWNIVDRVVPASRWAGCVRERVGALAGGTGPRGPAAAASGVVLAPLARAGRADGVDYRYVALTVDGRVGTILVRGPDAPPPASAADARAAADDLWLL